MLFFCYYLPLKEEEETKRQTPPTPPQEIVRRYPVNSGKLKKRRKRKHKFTGTRKLMFSLSPAEIEKALQG
jgi:hypothetical protein